MPGGSKAEVLLTQIKMEKRIFKATSFLYWVAQDGLVIQEAFSMVRCGELGWVEIVQMLHCTSLSWAQGCFGFLQEL